MSDEPPRKTITIQQLFQEFADYLERTSPPLDIEASLDQLKRRIEQEQVHIVDQRSLTIMSGRERWGRGYKIDATKDGQWTSVIDGRGNPVPPGDWDTFRAYLEAESAAKFAMIAESRWP